MANIFKLLKETTTYTEFDKVRNAHWNDWCSLTATVREELVREIKRKENESKEIQSKSGN